MPRHQQHHQQRPRAHFFYAAAALAAASWFLSPLPDYITGALVAAIPVAEDVALGVRGVRGAGYHLQGGCRPGRRCVEDIGRDVLGALTRHMPELHDTVEAYDWRFGVTQQSFVNAFAYPGGQIFVTRGLLDATTDDELAAVIGHEVGHVLRRHSQKRLVQQRLGRLLFSALLFGDGDGRAEGLGSEVGGLLHAYAHQLSTMSYSRANEFEADHVGFFACAAMGRGGCEPGALQSFFRKLDGGGGDTAWDSTHPGTRERIATLDAMHLAYREQRLAHGRGALGVGHGGGGGASAELRALAPSGLAAGAGSGLLGAAGSFWSVLPSEAQRAVLVGALWQAAAALERLWQHFMEGADDSQWTDEARRPRPQQRRYRDWAQPRYRPVD